MPKAATRQRVRNRAAQNRPKASADSLLLPRKPRSAYSAGDPLDQNHAGSYASRGSADADWLHDRLTAVARVRDVIRNEPIAASALEQKVALIVGDGWRFESAPDPAAFGVAAGSDEYEALAASIEQAWRDWCMDPLFRNDWEERLPFDLQLDLMVRNYAGAEGEAVALLLYDPVAGDGTPAPFGTRLQVLDPDRLEQPAGRPHGAGGEIEIELGDAAYTAVAHDIRAGVAYDDRGRVIAYHILDGHPYETGLSGAMNRFRGRWFPAHVPGFPGPRPCVIHLMKHRRAGQTRGISDFVSALGSLSAFRDIGESERRSRLINAMIVAQYTSAMNDPEALGEILGTKNADELLTARASFYEEGGVDRIAGARILQPFPGDKLEWNSEMRRANEWVDTMEFLALQSGAPIGLGYAMTLRDYSKTNFSSSRAEQNDTFRGVKRENANIKHLAYRPIMLAVLQEAYEEGRLAVPGGAPSIWGNPRAYLAGQIITPGRDYVDPVKEAAGDRMEVENLTESPSGIAARRGKSFEELVTRTARDLKLAQKHGVSMGDITALGALEGQLNPAEPPRQSE